MANQIRNEMEKIEIPQELRERAILGVNQAKQEMNHVPKKKNKVPLIAVAAAIILLTGSAIAQGGTTNLVNAGQTLISQIFSSEENVKKVDPVATSVELLKFEQHLALAEQVLTEAEFSHYRKLWQELSPLVEKMNVMENGVKTQNIKHLTKAEQTRLGEIQAELEPYEKIITNETSFSMEEAKSIAHYPIQFPTYVPKGYQLVFAKANTDEGSPTENPVVQMEYLSGEFGFRMFILSNETEDEVSRRSFERVDSYSYKGYSLDYAHSSDTNVSGMRISVPEKGQQSAYKIVMIADILPKEEMEKIILSVVEK
ncbi:hypothetical protein [Pseudoneobacillus sp. C159]